MTIIYLLLSFLLMPHDLKMSVCEIEYLRETGSFEVRFYLFQDDLKETVHGDPLTLTLEEEAVKQYITSHFDLAMDKKPLPLTYRNMAEKKDQVRVSFTSEKIMLGDHGEITVSNRLLIDSYRTQTNMTYVVLPGHNKMTKLFNAVLKESVFEW